MDSIIVLEKVKKSLARLYSQDAELFKKNGGKGVCERSLVFRLALYLQEEFNEYYVDCDYNSSYFPILDRGELKIFESPGKYISNPDGSFTSRYVDIIVHRRSSNTADNLVCIEVKKWGNSHVAEKDMNNVKFMTLSPEFNYKLGLLIRLGKNSESLKIAMFQNGRSVDTLIN